MKLTLLILLAATAYGQTQTTPQQTTLPVAPGVYLYVVKDGLAMTSSTPTWTTS